MLLVFCAALLHVTLLMKIESFCETVRVCACGLQVNSAYDHSESTVLQGGHAKPCELSFSNSRQKIQILNAT